MVIGFFTTDALIKLTHILPEECCHFVEGDHIHAVIEVGVIGAGNDEQLLVLAGELFVDTLAEIAGVRFLSVYQQHGRANLAAVLQDRHLQERQRGRHVPAAVGVQTAGMVSFIISPHWNML